MAEPFSAESRLIHAGTERDLAAVERAPADIDQALEVL